MKKREDAIMKHRLTACLLAGAMALALGTGAALANGGGVENGGIAAAAANLPFSCGSRANALTVRMAETFSCTLAFRWSYSSNTREKIGVACRMMAAGMHASTTMASRKIRLSLTLTRKHMTMLHSSISGARTAMRSSI